MANRPISMNKIKQIIRLYCGGIGSKKSNQITGVSRNVVKTYVRAFRSLGLTLEQVEALDDFALYALFHPQSEESRLPDIARYERLQKLLPQIARALRRKGMTLERQWQWYQSQDSDGYGRTQFLGLPARLPQAQWLYHAPGTQSGREGVCGLLWR